MVGDGSFVWYGELVQVYASFFVRMKLSMLSFSSFFSLYDLAVFNLLFSFFSSLLVFVLFSVFF